MSAVVANQAIVTVDPSGAGQHLLRTGRRPADRPGRHLHGRHRTSGYCGPVRADDRTDAHRGQTRTPALNPLGATNRPAPGSRSRSPVTGNPAIGRPDVAALVLDATSAGALTTGFVTVSTAGAVTPGQLPPTSTMNVTRPAQVLANHAIVPVSTRGFSMFTQAGGDMLADLAGYFIGNPAPGPFGGPVNARTRVLDPSGRVRGRPGGADHVQVVTDRRRNAAGSIVATRILERRR